MAHNTKFFNGKNIIKPSPQLSRHELNRLEARNLNPLTKLAMSIAGVAAPIVAKKLLSGVWKAAFNERVPDKKHQKLALKDLKEQQKAARKAGMSKSDVKLMKSEYDQIPSWKLALFTVLSGVAMTAVKQLASSGARHGTNVLISRRPRSNRG